MASSIEASLLIIPLCFLILIFPPTTKSSPPPRPNLTLLQQACGRTPDPEFCVNYLSQTPRVVNASNARPSPRLPLAIAIAESGLTYAELGRDYTANKIARDAPVKSAYAECARFFDGSVAQLGIALDILRRRGLADAVNASRSLVGSADGVTRCNQTLVSVNVEDRYFRATSKQVLLYSLAADTILADVKVKGEMIN